MIKLFRFCVLTCLLALSFSAHKPAAAEDHPVVVAEMFTSRYCPACPAADRLLNEMASDHRIIALSYHVDYWDKRGRGANPLSHEFATHRQRSYKNFGTFNSIYTPQLVANGDGACVGSRTNEVERLMSNTASIPQIKMQSAGTNSLVISLPNVRADSYTLWLAGVKKNVNDGKFNYTNAVQKFIPAGAWRGRAQAQNIILEPDAAIDGYVILAQRRGYGEIVAAGKIDL